MRSDLVLRGGLAAHVQRVRRLLTPVLLKRPIGLLTSRELRHWRDGQLSSGLAASSVTRTCKALKACLNHAAEADEQSFTFRVLRQPQLDLEIPESAAEAEARRWSVSWLGLEPVSGVEPLLNALRIFTLAGVPAAWEAMFQQNPNEA